MVEPTNAQIAARLESLQETVAVGFERIERRLDKQDERIDMIATRQGHRDATCAAERTSNEDLHRQVDALWKRVDQQREELKEALEKLTRALFDQAADFRALVQSTHACRTCLQVERLAKVETVVRLQLWLAGVTTTAAVGVVIKSVWDVVKAG